jgi:hypothetical protein
MSIATPVSYRFAVLGSGQRGKTYSLDDRDLSNYAIGQLPYFAPRFQPATSASSSDVLAARSNEASIGQVPRRGGVIPAGGHWDHCAMAIHAGWFAVFGAAAGVAEERSGPRLTARSGLTGRVFLSARGHWYQRSGGQVGLVGELPDTVSGLTDAPNSWLISPSGPVQVSLVPFFGWGVWYRLKPAAI